MSSPCHLGCDGRARRFPRRSCQRIARVLGGGGEDELVAFFVVGDRECFRSDPAADGAFRHLNIAGGFGDCEVCRWAVQV